MTISGISTGISAGTVDASSITSGTIDAARMYAYVGTWAGKPSAALYASGVKARITDVGLSGTDFESDGTKWVQSGGSFIYSRTELPLLLSCTIPADASPTANGAITFGTALNVRIDKAFVYFAAGVVHASQAAGFFYTEFSNTTAAVVYNNTYSPAEGVHPTEPTAKAQFSGAVPGGAGTTAEVTAFVNTIHGGLLGLSGSLAINIDPGWPSTGTNKVIRIKLDGTAVSDSGNGTGGSGTSSSSFIKNIQSQSIQLGKSSFFTTSNFGYRTAIDTSINKPLSITLQKAAATDWLCIYRYEVMARV